jgi:hypothetical protein
MSLPVYETFPVKQGKVYGQSLATEIPIAHERRTRWKYFLLGVLAILSVVYYIRQLPASAHVLESPGESRRLHSPHGLPLKPIPPGLQRFQHCSIKTLKEETHYNFLSTATPPSLSEFAARRNRLAEALVAEGLDAFVVEPGYTFSYYGNVTQPDCKSSQSTSISTSL